ncbi:response regulator transcription factor [Amycolatopsis sp. NPDC049688]|uniref:helix-turn-helix domain-containing protein n=1 Tax=Amycolatopsis sp. NPDC049688 TaxID=3154733 RepID=UPI00343CD0D5
MQHEVFDQNDVSPGELFRLIRAHQEIAQALLARLEQICQSRPDTGNDDRSSGGRWHLTDRERNVADLLAEGLSNRRIARSLGISERTVKNHLHAIFHKLGVGDRTHAVIRLLRDT